MIRWTYAFIDRPAEHFDRANAFWTAVTGTRLSLPRGDRDEFVTLLPDAGAGADAGVGADACVKAQAVGDGPGGAHLDLAVEDVTAFVRHATELGASVVAEYEDEGLTVLRSPGGMPFCAVPWQGEKTRSPVVAGSRLDQVCVDVAPAAYDAEVAYWAGLTGWRSAAGALPEFHSIKPPPDLPVRILIQRLDTARPTTAHLDLACADLTATRTRHERHGARYVGRGSWWLVMRDPTGGPYCLTGRDPDSGTLPTSATH